MIKALKVTMYIVGVVGILFGLAYILIPQQLGEVFGYQTSSEVGYLTHFLAAYGGLFVVGSVFVIIAARDPLQHISWVKYAIAWTLVSLAVDAYSIMVGTVDFGEAMGGMIIAAVFAAALLIFYPYRAAKEA
jgi:uncharacterized membrane protein